MSRSWLEHVANAEAFSAENFVIGSGGTFAQVMLRNPPASGVRVRLRSVHATSNVAIGVNLRRHDTPLGTLGLPATFITENLLSSVAADSQLAEHRRDSAVAAAGTVVWQLSAPPNLPAIFPPEGRPWGYDLLEGQSILMQGASGATLIVMWQWAELSL